MFRFFKSRAPFEPLDQESRNYLEHNMWWLSHEYPQPPVNDREVLTPTEKHFPVNWDFSANSGKQTLAIIAKQMLINPDKIKLTYFSKPPKEINVGSSVIFLENDPTTPEAAGIYYEKKW
ncbi:MAG: hypothetical protein WD077_04715 [Bacteroidia bacterium]